MKFVKLFQDIHVMVFVGFGFLMTFLRRYAFSALGFTLLLGAILTQWAIICRGIYDFDGSYKILINFESLCNADITTCSVLISLGVILGITSHLQLLIMGMLEIFFFSLNIYISSSLLKVCDTGGSVLVHAFGAYFGLAVSFVIGRAKNLENHYKSSRYNSDIFSMIGTLFLWLYWPSFNGISLPLDLKHRAIMNTYLSLASCCVTTFAVSTWFNGNEKFDMTHIQNSTLAGGVAIGSTVCLVLQPYGAIIIGMISGLLSVVGFTKLTPWLYRKLNMNDTCGVHNLHGIPGILGGFIAILLAYLATEEDYGTSLYYLYPARSSIMDERSGNLTTEFNSEKDESRSAVSQAGFQLISIVITLLISISSGSLTGFLINSKKLQLSSEDFFTDTPFWKTDYE